MVKFFKFYSSSNGNLYLLILGSKKILIDPGVSINKICDNIDLNNVDYVLLSHKHKDHSFSAKILSEFGKTIITGKSTANDLNLISPVILNHEDVFITIDENNNNIKIKALKAFHNVENLMFYIEYKNNKILYSIDTNKIPYRFNGLTHLYIECNYQKELIQKDSYNSSYYHLEQRVTLDFIKKNSYSLKEVQLLHISSRYGDKEMFEYNLSNLKEWSD